MLTQLIIRLLTPVIVEVIKELLSQLATGQTVQIDERTVAAAMNAREPRLNQVIQRMKVSNEIPDI